MYFSTFSRFSRFLQTSKSASFRTLEVKVKKPSKKLIAEEASLNFIRNNFQIFVLKKAHLFVVIMSFVRIYVSKKKINT